MLQLCRRCFSPLLTGQEVSGVFTSVYKQIPSKIQYAINRDRMSVDPDTLVHALEKDCIYDEDYKV